MGVLAAGHGNKQSEAPARHLDTVLFEGFCQFSRLSRCCPIVLGRNKAPSASSRCFSTPFCSVLFVSFPLDVRFFGHPPFFSLSLAFFVCLFSTPSDTAGCFGDNVLFTLVAHATFSARVPRRSVFLFVNSPGSIRDASFHASRTYASQNSIRKSFLPRSSPAFTLQASNFQRAIQL